LLGIIHERMIIVTFFQQTYLLAKKNPTLRPFFPISRRACVC
jgi:hypothetical protein